MKPFKFRTSKTAKMKTEYGIFNICIFKDDKKNISHSALWIGDLNNNKKLLVRAQSSCITSTAFYSNVCDCNQQIKIALELISKEGCGVILYMEEEGRGHGLLEKINTVKCMNDGATTVSAFEQRGLEPDIRTHLDSIAILKHLTDIREVSLVTNNPNKIKCFTDNNFIVKRIPVEATVTDDIKDYLLVKKESLNHMLSNV